MFDKRDEYKRFVEPHLRKAYAECRVHGIPFFSSCCIADDGTFSNYKNLINGSVSNGIELADDQFSKHINVSNGFDTYLKDERRPNWGSPEKIEDLTEEAAAWQPGEK